MKNDSKLDTRRAITVTETLLSQFHERMYLVTDYYEHWKVHVSSGKEFKSQWAQFVKDARKVRRTHESSSTAPCCAKILSIRLWTSNGKNIVRISTS